MKIEVMFVTTAKVAGFRHPAVVTFEDGPLVRGLLKGGHVVLIDPPHLPGYNDDEFPAAPEPEVIGTPGIDLPEEIVVAEPAVEDPVIYVPSVTLWPKEPVIKAPMHHVPMDEPVIKEPVPVIKEPDKQEAVKENQETKTTKRKYVRRQERNEDIQ